MSHPRVSRGSRVRLARKQVLRAAARPAKAVIGRALDAARGSDLGGERTKRVHVEDGHAPTARPHEAPVSEHGKSP